jgi:hypothetical protein
MEIAWWEFQFMLGLGIGIGGFKPKEPLESPKTQQAIVEAC